MIEYAVKEIKSERLKTTLEISKLLEEKLIMKQLTSDSIVSFKGSFTDENGSEFLVMEYCNGADLRYLIKAKGTKLSEA